MARKFTTQYWKMEITRKLNEKVASKKKNKKSKGRSVDLLVVNVFVKHFEALKGIYRWGHPAMPCDVVLGPELLPTIKRFEKFLYPVISYMYSFVLV